MPVWPEEPASGPSSAWSTKPPATEPTALPIAAPVMAAPNRLKPPGSSAPPMAEPTAPRTNVAIK